MKTRVITENITEAAELIRQGALVAVPTETVYGLAGSGFNETAVERIYEVKGRPEVKPLSLMVAAETRPPPDYQRGRRGERGPGGQAPVADGAGAGGL